MIWKKWICTAWMLTMLGVLTACGKQEDNANVATPPVEETTTQEATTEVAEEQVVITVLTDKT